MALINEPSRPPFSQKHHPRLYISTSTTGPRLPDRPSPLKHLSMRRGSDGDMQLILRRRSSAASSKSARQAMAHALANVASGEFTGGGVKALPESYRKRARAEYSRARKQLLVASITCSVLHRMERNRSANPAQVSEQSNPYPNSLFIDDDDSLEGEYLDSDSDESASLDSDFECASTSSFSPHDRSQLCASSFFEDLRPPSFAPSAEYGYDHSRNDLGYHPNVVSQAPKPATEPETLGVNDHCTRLNIRQERSAVLKTLLSRRSLTGSTVTSPKSETGPSTLPLTVPCAYTSIESCTEIACTSLCSPPDSTLSDTPRILPATNANNICNMSSVPSVEEVHLTSPTSINTSPSLSGNSTIIHLPSYPNNADDETVALNNAEMGGPVSTKSTDTPCSSTKPAKPSKASRPILRINTSLKDPLTVHFNYLGIDNDGTKFRTTRAPSMPQLMDLPRPKVFQQRMRSRSSPTMYMGRRKKGPPPPLDLQGLTERTTHDVGKDEGEDAPVTQRRHRAKSLIETLAIRVSAARSSYGLDSNNSTPNAISSDDVLPIHHQYAVPSMPKVNPMECVPSSLAKWTGQDVRDLAKFLDMFANMMDSNPGLQPESIASSIPATLLELIKLAANSAIEPTGL